MHFFSCFFTRFSTTLTRKSNDRSVGSIGRSKAIQNFCATLAVDDVSEHSDMELFDEYGENEDMEAQIPSDCPLVNLIDVAVNPNKDIGL